VIGGIAVLGAVGGGFYYSRKRKAASKSSTAADPGSYDAKDPGMLKSSKTDLSPVGVDSAPTLSDDTGVSTTLVNPDLCKDASERLRPVALPESLVAGNRVFSYLIARSSDPSASVIEVRDTCTALKAYEAQSWDELTVETGGGVMIDEC
jgi:hypothetical protein